jgi:heme/copper-type cytochrome/quinol oxidase subunit 2
VNRKIFTYFLLCCVVAWLVLSYWPFGRSLIPLVSFPLGWRNELALLGAISICLFIGVQLWLVITTTRSLRKRQASPGKASPDAGLRLNVQAEIFWTALPIGITILLGVAGYWIWLAR